MTAQSANSSNSKLWVATFPVGMLQCNCSIVADPISKETAVIDPGGNAEDIVRLLEENGLKAKYLLHTHAHFDHFLGSAKVAEKTGAKICVHKDDEWLYQNLAMQGEFMGMDFSREETKAIDHFLEDDEELQLGEVKAKVIHTPGHTPGSTCFCVQEQDESLLFAGDTLFHNSIGRTDLWGGSYDDIRKSIREKLFRLEESTQVIAGHGPDTTIWEEKRHNPYVG